MRIYRVKDWDLFFENNKSRDTDRCSFVCVPNKQHGMGFSRIMAESDGSTVYGVWQLIIGACSQQRRPRQGWLTSDGHQTGTAWTPEDLALKFRRPASEIERTLNLLSSGRIGWLEAYEASENQSLIAQPQPSAPEVPPECPAGVLKEGRKEGKKEGSESVLSPTPDDEAKESAMSDSEWLESLCQNSSYDGIDVRREYGKMEVWCKANNKKPVRRRFVNWLNRCEKPMRVDGINSKRRGPNI